MPNQAYAAPRGATPGPPRVVDQDQAVAGQFQYETSQSIGSRQHCSLCIRPDENIHALCGQRTDIRKGLASIAIIRKEG